MNLLFQRRRDRILMQILLFVMALFWIFPLYGAIRDALSPGGWHNFVSLFTQPLGGVPIWRTSLNSFAIGAIIPLFPYLIGSDALWVALLLAALAAIVGGGLVARLTARPFWRGALRQLLLGVVAATFTYLIGLAIGAMATA